MADANLPDTAPDFTLEHVLGHPVSMSDFSGRTVVVMFGGRDSAEQVKQGVQAIRESHDPDALPVLAISDLQAVPRPARILPKKQLKKAYEEAVQDLTSILEAQGKPAPDDPSTAVVMLMDWEGDAVKGFGVSGVEQEAVAVVVGADGKVIGAGSGPQVGEQALALVP